MSHVASLLSGEKNGQRIGSRLSTAVKGEDRFGNVILMYLRDTYFLLGIGENELSALMDVRKIAYFNFDDVQIEDINKYLKIEFPPLYSDN